MAFLGDLILRLKAETADFQQDLGKATRDAEQAGRKITAALSGIQGVLVSLGAAASAGALVAVVKQAIDSADAMNKMSQKIGVSVEALTALKYAAELSDVPVEALQTGLKKLSTAMFESQAGSREQAALFKGLGVSAADADGKLRETQEVLLDVADKFSKMQDGALKSALAVKLFGKSGIDLIPLLNGGREGIEALMKEAERLGVVMSGATAKAAEEFNDNLRRLKAQTEGLVVSFVGSLLPSLLEAQKEFAMGSLKAGSFKNQMLELVQTRDKVESWFETVAVGAGFMLTTLELLKRVVVTLATPVERLGLNIFNLGQAMGIAFDPNSTLKEKREAMTAARDEAQRRFRELDARERANSPFDPNFVPYEDRARKFFSDMRDRRDIGQLADVGNRPEPPKRTPDAKDFKPSGLTPEQELKMYTSAAQQLEQQLGKLNHQSEAEKLTYQLTKGSLKELTAEHKAALMVLAKEIDARKNALMVSEETMKSYDQIRQRQEALNKQQTADFESKRRMIDQMEYEASLVGKTQREVEVLNFKRSISVQLEHDLAQAAQEAGDDMAQYETQRAVLIAQANETMERGIDIIVARQQVEREWAVGAKRALESYAESAMNAAANAERFFTNAFQSMEDALVKFVQTGKLDFKSLADSIIADLIRMEVRASITGPIAKAMSDNGGLFGGGLLKGVGSFFGDLFRADGGGVSANMPYIVGEKGPELMVPSSSGTVVPNGHFGGGDTYYIDARGADREGLARLEAAIVRLNGSFNERAVAAVFNAQQRGMRA